MSRGIVVAGATGCFSESDPGGELTAVSAETGRPVWNTRTFEDTAVADLVVRRGLVFTVGASEGSGFSAEAHDLTTGALRWSHEGPVDCGLATAARIAIVAARVVYADCQEGDTASPRMVAVDPSTGGVVWTRAGDWAVLAGDTGAKAGTDLYARDGTTGFIADVNPGTGQIKAYLPASVTAVLAVGARRLYVLCTDGVCAYGRSSLQLLWRIGLALAHPIAAYAGGIVYLNNGLAINASSGARLRDLWRGRASYVTVGDGMIVAIRGATAVDVFGL